MLLSIIKVISIESETIGEEKDNDTEEENYTNNWKNYYYSSSKQIETNIIIYLSSICIYHWI